MAIKILVIGSINIDEVNYIKKFPLIGETIVVDEFFEFHGGKGANQAVATRRLINEKKHEVFLFAKVGNDDYGDKAIKNLKKDNINTQYVFKSKTKPTGKAIILISYLEKDNKIIINKGANEDFGDNDLNNLEEAIKECDIIVMQLEVNEFLIENALKIAKKNKKIVIMNPSPATTFNNKWFPFIDYFIPNESELENISNQKLKNISEIESALQELRKKGLKNAIVTLGDAGVYLSLENEKKWLEAKKTKIVDTTAAGDTFIGGFIAFCLLKNDSNTKITKMMNNVLVAAALTVSKRGAQKSIPTWKEVIREKNKSY